MDPQPLMRPVTVPSDLLLPRTDGWEARSAATADVMMLLGLYMIESTNEKIKEIREMYVSPAALNINQTW